MRQLFVPACLCLMTLSNSTGFDLPLEKTPNADKRTIARETDDLRGISADGDATERVAGDESSSSSSEMIALAPSEDSAVADLSSIDPSKIPLPPVPKPVVPRSREEICQTLSEAAQNNDLPVPFFIRLLFQESRFRSEAVSAAGAQGIAQFMPETSATEGLGNPFDPLEAIPASARLLRKLIAQFGNVGLAAAAYNAGPKRIQDWLEKKGALPQETQGYVKNITGRPAETWKVASASGTALSLPYRAPCKEVVLPIPTPAPRARTTVASADTKAPSAHESHVTAKVTPVVLKTKNKVKPDTQKATAKAEKAEKAEKVEKATKSRPHAPRKAPTQQLAARKHDRGAEAPARVAQQ